MLDARVLDVDVLDAYLIDLLWRPFLWRVPALRSSDTDDSPTTATTPPLDSASASSWIVMRWLRKLSRPERVELLRLGTLVAAGTTPASRLLGLQWKEGSPTSLSDSPKTSAFPRLWGYCLLRAAAVALRRYHAHVKRLLLNHQSRSEQERGNVQLQQQQLRTLQLQEGLLRIVHRILAAARLAVLFGATLGVEPGPAASSTPSIAPSRYGLAMLLSGNAYRDGLGDGDADVDGGDSGQLPTSTPRLHVDYAHRRWLWREGSAALRLLLAGVLSSAMMREAWQPLLRRTYERSRDAFEGGAAAAWCLAAWNRNRTEVKDSNPSLAASPKNGKSSPRACPLCGTSPVRIPVRADCGHVYCYVCLYRRSLRRVVGGTQRQHSSGGRPGKECTASTGPFRCRVCRTPISYAFPIPG